MTESIGQILKKTRLEKKLTIKEISDSTKIMVRHITALENENFDSFPGETYTLGFLRSYATFLGLDSDQIVQLYKGSQIEVAETPLEQLTQPISATADYIKKYLLIGVASLLIFAIGFFVFTKIDGPIFKAGENQEANALDISDHLKKSLKIPDIQTDHLKLSSGYATALVSVSNGIDFSVNNKEVYLILNQLNYKTLENQNSSAILSFYPGKSTIELIENKTIEVNEEGIDPFQLTLKGTTPRTIKVAIQVKNNNATAGAQEQNTNENRIANPSNFILIFEGITTGENFVEFYVDGRLQKKGLIPSGSHLYYEANESIQLKIGDAGAMKIKVNGKSQRFGKRGQQVNKIIRKVKDPVEQTRFTYTIKDT